MEQIIEVRFNRNGDFHRGDLTRLVVGKIINVELPTDPRHGSAMVTIDAPDVQQPIEGGSELSTRPPTFHP